MTNYEISKALGAVRHQLTRDEHESLRIGAQRYANLMCEAKPGKYVRREAIALLKQCREAAR